MFRDPKFGCLKEVIMAYFNGIEELIGSTPLIRLSRYCKGAGVPDVLFGKLEMFNPTGSAKDRPALYMLKDMEQSGRLGVGGTVIEPTSGNTGIGLAAVGAARGYRVILVMPDTMSVERIRLLTAYGANVVLTPGKDGMRGAILKAEELNKSIPGSVIAGQFTNPVNSEAHYKTTGPELFDQMDGRTDAFVAGVGTGGTLTGCARYLKEQNKSIKIFAVEPESSPLLSKGVSGVHGLQGIGANFVPQILDTALIDDVIAVSDTAAFSAAKLLARSEGLLCGITSGAALAAAGQVALKGFKNIAVLLPDSGDRYLSTGIYD